MAGSGSSEMRTPIFADENYEFWRIKMVTIFKSHGLWNLVEKMVTTLDSKKKKVEGSSEEKDDEKIVVVYMQDAKALDLRREFEYTRMRNDESLSGYLTRLNELINQMKTFGEVLSNERLVQKRFDMHTVDTTEKAFSSLFVSSKGQQNRARVNGNWYIDSGCSNHMTGNVNLLIDVRTNVAGKVQMPTGDLANVVGMGSLVIDTTEGRKYIKEVMYLLGLKENLLSVGQMDKHGYYLLFGGKVCSVFDGPSLDNLEEVYVDQPEGFVINGKEDKVYRLHKALYGLNRHLEPKAEYISALEAIAQAIWFRFVLEDFGELQTEATPLQCDNTSAISITKNPMFH
ncbi:uncharacterized protein [Pyrus communis]|uniref:uncharacterized protein n=1 Tax=Pyrus communis TaxID=23211 RepID=UPI0035BFC295